MKVTRDDLYISDIANPGYGPFYAIHAKVGKKAYVLTDARALFSTYEAATPLFNKIWTKGEINLDLWECSTMSESEREEYFGQDGLLYQWEEMEKLNGNW